MLLFGFKVCTSFFLVQSYSVLAAGNAQETMSKDRVIVLVFALRRMFRALHLYNILGGKETLLQTVLC